MAKLSQHTYQIAGIGNGQAQRILDALCYWPAGEWCPMPHLARVASDSGLGTGICVSRRIYDLRRHVRKQGYEIIQDSHRSGDGRVHSFYRLVKRPGATQAAAATPGTPQP